MCIHIDVLQNTLFCKNRLITVCITSNVPSCGQWQIPQMIKQRLNKRWGLTTSSISALHCSSCHLGNLLPFINMPLFFLMCKHLNAQEWVSQKLRLKLKCGEPDASTSYLRPLEVCSSSPLDHTLLIARGWQQPLLSHSTHWCVCTTAGFHGVHPAVEDSVLHWLSDKNLPCMAQLSPWQLAQSFNFHHKITAGK